MELHGKPDNLGDITELIDDVENALAELEAHIADTSDAHDASAISILDTGNDFTATDVEGALAELQSDAEADAAALAAHLADTSDAHDASAISIADAANDFTATDVEGALAELQSDAEAHLADTSDAHDASAISIVDSGNYYTGTDVEAALQEIGAGGIGGGGGGSGEALQISIDQTAHGFSVGQVLYWDGDDLALAKADDAATAEVVGLVASADDPDVVLLHIGGYMADMSGLTPGTVYFLSDSTPGAWTETEPTAEGSISKPFFIALSDSAGFFFNFRGMVIGTADEGGGGGSAERDPIADLFGDPDTGFEFDANDFTGLTKLSTTADVEDMDTTVPGCLFIQDDSTGDNYYGRYAAATAPFTVVTKLLDDSGYIDYNLGGLFVGEATPGKLVNWGRVNSSRHLQRNNFVSPTNSGGSSADTGYAKFGLPYYLALRVNSDTDIDFLYSDNGYTWRKFIDSHNPSFTVGSAGVGLYPGTGGIFSMAWEFLRIWNSALTFPGVAA